MRQLTILAILALSLTVLAGCGGGEASVTGEVTYLQRIALPDDAVITVQLQDISRADAAAEVLGEDIIEAGGDPVPFEYEVSYSEDDIVDNHTYSVSARITDGEGSLIFISDTVIPVITNDNPTSDVEIVVVPVGSSAGSASITGVVTYLQRSALPDDAVVTVQLQDISRMDVPAEILGEQVIQTGGSQVPFPYAVSYDAGSIVDNHTYGMIARITDGEGKLLFINDTTIPVITRGNPTSDVEILVVPVG